MVVMVMVMVMMREGKIVKARERRKKRREMREGQIGGKHHPRSHFHISASYEILILREVESWVFLPRKMVSQCYSET